MDTGRHSSVYLDRHSPEFVDEPVFVYTPGTPAQDIIDRWIALWNHGHDSGPRVYVEPEIHVDRLLEMEPKLIVAFGDGMTQEQAEDIGRQLRDAGAPSGSIVIAAVDTSPRPRPET